jgi:DNA mismatch endonuclease, patch repair protein
MDTVPKVERSRIMRAVHSRNNESTELRVGRILWANGIKGYRKHWPILGNPDFCWPGRKLALFVDGCFWHGCPRCSEIPSTNTSYWTKKIARNRSRDLRVTRALRRQGWKVQRIWECDIQRQKFLNPLRAALAATGLDMG